MLFRFFVGLLILSFSPHVFIFWEQLLLLEKEIRKAFAQLPQPAQHLIEGREIASRDCFQWKAEKCQPGFTALSKRPVTHSFLFKRLCCAIYPLLWKNTLCCRRNVSSFQICILSPSLALSIKMTFTPFIFCGGIKDFCQLSFDSAQTSHPRFKKLLMCVFSSTTVQRFSNLLESNRIGTKF